MLAGFEETLLLIVQDDSELLEMCQKCIYQLKNTTAEHHFFVPRKKSYLQDPTCIALTKAFQQELQRAGSEGQKRSSIRCSWRSITILELSAFTAWMDKNTKDHFVQKRIFH